MEQTKLDEADFRELEAFVRRTSRGRAFLDEYAERSRTVAAGEVMSAIDGLREVWLRHEEGRVHAQRIDVLRRELQDMSASIAQARREIAAIRPKDGNDRIMTAANELDAIVMSTERASIEILGAAERILEASETLKAGDADEKAVEVVQNEVTTIFTACSFQDLTGQRTTKVVNALRYIEQRIMTLMDLWGVDGQPVAALPKEVEDSRPDAHLLHGPSDDGIDQSEIDALLSGGAMPPPRPAAAPAPAVRPSEPAKSTPPAASAAEEDLPQLSQSSIDDLFA